MFTNIFSRSMASLLTHLNFSNFLFLQLQSLHFINHRRYFFNESNRDINCAKADEIYSLKYKHQHGKDIVSVQFSSVAQSCPTLCDPMNSSTPGPSVHHQLSEFNQTL